MNSKSKITDNYNVNEQKMINKQDWLELSEMHSSHCVSIFVPTHRAGEEILKGKDALTLRACSGFVFDAQ